MKAKQIFPIYREFSMKTLPKDIFAGVVIALVSIPISMGYAQVAGLPARFGLYGSIFPILIFGLLSSTRRFVFGVDAAPAALVGAFLAEQGIQNGSAQAVTLVPMITLAVGLWLGIMYFFGAGRIVKYISTPVMGGFISGISATIILMQVPKILGGTSGTGELAELILHIVDTCTESFNPASLVMGCAALLILIAGKKLAPRLPLSVAVMAAGAVIGYTGLADKYGVVRLASVEKGLPAWSLPYIEVSMISDVIRTSLPIALVIMSETLLASGSTAAKDGEKIDSKREILVYTFGNIAAAMVGCCPVNGSVSRTAMGGQLGARSQIMSVSAAVTMAGLLLLGTSFIGFLPVPVLTSIVIAALLGAVEFDLAKKLRRQDKRELGVFLGAFFGVLIFGTVYGVAIGAVLSFADVIMSTARPKRSFLGVIPGHEGFHSLERNSQAAPIRGAVLYRFSGSVYFANVGLFVSDIEGALNDESRCVIVDSGAIVNIDVTAAEGIEALSERLRGRGVGLYFASHIGSLNDRFRQLGLGKMVETGHCRRTITAALEAAGFSLPYELDGHTSDASGDLLRTEFEWAFGELADSKLEEYAEKLTKTVDNVEELKDAIASSEPWGAISELDREELLAHLETHIHELSDRLGADEQELSDSIELGRLRLVHSLVSRDHRVLALIRSRNLRFEEELKHERPELYRKLKTFRIRADEHIRQTSPEYAVVIDEMTDSESNDS